MITDEINLFGLARVEDECKTQKRFIEFVIIPSRHWTRTRTYFSLPLLFKVCRNKLIYQKYAMKSTLITLKCEWTPCFSQQYANHCLRYVFSIVACQVSRNIVLETRSVMITIFQHFNSQSDCSILGEVTRRKIQGNS